MHVVYTKGLERPLCAHAAGNRRDEAPDRDGIDRYMEEIERFLRRGAG